MTEHHSYKHIIPIQIRFNDIDGQQHVINAVYQSYFDIGREGYFSAIHEKDYHTGGRSVIIASAHTDFRKPVFRHDSIQVETTITEIGNKSMKMVQRIAGSDNDEVYAEGTTVFVGFDYESQETILIQPEMVAAIEKYERKHLTRREKRR
jgi:acyl-CoA thioester hydrolase